MYIMFQRIQVLFNICCHFATLYSLVTNAAICVALYPCNTQKRIAPKMGW
jgi:hypothetical protein